MKVEEPFDNHTYTFCLQQNPPFTLTMILRTLEDEVFEMQFSNKEGLIFELAVSQQYIDSIHSLSLFFNCPRILFKAIFMNTDKLTISQEGEVTFKVKLFDYWQKLIKFTAKNKEITLEDKVIRFLEKAKKDNQLDIQLLKSENHQLKQQLDSMVKRQEYQQTIQMILCQLKRIGNDKFCKQELYAVKKSNQELKDLVQMYKEDIINFKQECSRQMKALYRQVVQNRKQKQDNILKAKGQMEKDANLENYILKIEESEEVNQPELQFSLPQQSIEIANNKHFASEIISGRIRLRYKSNGIDYGFVIPSAIEIGKVTKQNLRQIKTQYKDIMYGLCTDNTIGLSSPYNHAECISYSAQYGCVWYNKKGSKYGHIVNDGSTVTIIADLINWKVFWEVDGNKAAESSIPVRMRRKKIYFLLTMYTKNDEVDVLDCSIE